MNKISFVSSIDSSEMIKKSKLNLIYGFVFLFISILCFVISIILAEYNTRIFWMIFGSFLSIVPLIISLCFFFKRKHELDFNYLYLQLINSEGEEIIGEYISISEDKITLQNGFEVYTMKINVNDNIRNIYVISDKIDLLKTESNHTYRFVVVSSFLKEISDA